MTYINPFELFEIRSTSTPLVEKAIADKRLSLESTSEGFLQYGQIRVDKQLLHQAATELQDSKLAAYHQFILDRPRLLRFLKTGDTVFFDYYKKQKLFSSYAFKEFIAPHYIAAFNYAFLNAFEGADQATMELMLEIPALVLPEQEEVLFKSIDLRLQAILKQLKNILNASWENWTSQEIKKKVLVNWTITSLNALPKRFEVQRSDIALAICIIAKKVQEYFTADESSFIDLIDVAYTLKVKQHIGHKINNESHFLQNQHQQKQANAVLLLKGEQRKMLDHLKLLRADIEAERCTSIEALSKIEDILELEKINKLPDALYLLKQALISELGLLALILWEKEEDIDVFNTLFEKARAIEKTIIDYSFPKGTPHKLLMLDAAISCIRHHIRHRRTSSFYKADGSKICQLLTELFPSELLPLLVRPEHKRIKQHILEALLPVIHFTRKKAPFQILSFLEHIDTIVKSDPKFEHRVHEIDHRIIEDLQQVPKQQKAKFVYAKPAQRDPLDRVTLIEHLQDQYKHLRAFLFEERSGPSRLTQLATILGIGTILAIASVTVVPMLYISQPVPKAPEGAYKDFVPFVHRPVAKFVQEKSKYIGNQLKNGARPYIKCFNKDAVLAGSGNEIHIENSLGLDAIAVLYDADSYALMRHIYIRGNQSHTFRNLPPANYKVRFYIGKDWNPLKPNFCGGHGAFDTNPQYVKLANREGVLACEGNSKHRLNLDLGRNGRFRKFPTISATGFFYNKVKHSDEDLLELEE